MRYFAVIVVGLLFLGVSPVYAGKIFKWVDKNGVTHYGQVPPADVEETTNITLPKGGSYNTVKPVEVPKANNTYSNSSDSYSNPSKSYSNDQGNTGDGPDCSLAMDNIEYGVEVMLERAREKYKEGTINNDQYHQVQKAMSDIRRHASVSDCSTATGKEYQLYKCMSTKYSVLGMCILDVAK